MTWCFSKVSLGSRLTHKAVDRATNCETTVLIKNLSKIGRTSTVSSFYAANVLQLVCVASISMQLLPSVHRKQWLAQLPLLTSD